MKLFLLHPSARAKHIASPTNYNKNPHSTALFNLSLTCEFHCCGSNKRNCLSVTWCSIANVSGALKITQRPVSHVAVPLAAHLIDEVVFTSRSIASVSFRKWVKLWELQKSTALCTSVAWHAVYRLASLCRAGMALHSGNFYWPKDYDWGNSASTVCLRQRKCR
jgi:hypothetical protein